MIKLFASASIRDHGAMNVTQEQIDAVCGEAKAQGLPHDRPRARSGVDPCARSRRVANQSPDRAWPVCRRRGDQGDKEGTAGIYAANPNIGLVLQNYLENKDKYMGSGNFNEEGFAAMQGALPVLEPMFRKALAAGL